MSYTRENRRRTSWVHLHGQKSIFAGSNSLADKIRSFHAKKEAEAYQQSRRELSWRWLDADRVLNSLEEIQFV